MLQRQLLPIPFLHGQDETTDPRSVPPGTQTSLINCHLAKPQGVNKRNGYAAVGGSGSYTATSLYGHSLGADQFQRIFPFVDTACVINQWRAWMLSRSGLVLSDIDAVTPVHATRWGAGSAANAIEDYDCALLSNGTLLIAYCENSVMHVEVFDPTSGTCLSQQVSGQAADSCKVVTITGQPQAYIVSQLASSAGTLNIASFSITSFVLTAGAAATTGCTGSQRWDACTVDGVTPPNTFMMAWCSSGTQFTVAIINAGMGVQTTASFTAGASGDPIAISIRATQGENFWILYSAITGGGTTYSVRILGIDPLALGSTTADSQIDSGSGAVTARLGVERIDSTHCMCAYSVNPGYGMTTKWASVQAASATVGKLRTMQQMALGSVPFSLDGSVYAQLMFSSSQTPPIIVAGGAASQPSSTAYLVDLLAGDSTTTSQSGQLRAIVAPRIVTFTTTLSSIHSPHVATNATNAYTLVPSIRSATDPNGIDVVRYSNSRSLHQAAALGGSVYLSGGVVCACDGVRVTEMGFTYNCASVQVSASSTGGSMIDSPSPGTAYTYAVVWEWRDALGQRKQSQPVFQNASVIDAGSGNTGSVALTVPDLSLTLCQDSESGWLPYVSLAIYRTAPSVVAGVFYRLFSSNIPVSTLLSVPYGVANVTYTDTAADTAITGNEQLYTGGGVLSNNCPSSMKCLIAHNGRLVGIGDDDTTIWYTTAWDGGTTQPRFNDALTLTIADAGRLTALASMDGNLIVFSKQRIYVISGDGPDETGAGATWTSPRNVPTEVGCDTDWRSVVVTPMGILFQHGLRIYLLDRSLSCRYFSASVANTITSYPVVTSATLVPDQEQVRFTLAASDGSTSGRVVAFDYLGTDWSVYNLYDSDATVQGFSPNSACYTSAGYVWMSNKGQPWFETVGAYLDPGSTWISMSAQGADIAAAGILGWARFCWAQLGMQYNTDANITVSLSMDHAATFGQTQTWTAQMLNDQNTTAQTQVKLHIVQQKASSVVVNIADAAPTNGTVGTGQGYTWFGLMLDVGVKKGLRRLPQQQGA